MQTDALTDPVPPLTPELGLLAQRVKRIREARRLSMRQLGELTGTSASSLSPLERGLTGATAATPMQIAQALSISGGDRLDDRTPATQRIRHRTGRAALSKASDHRRTLLSPRPIHDFEARSGNSTWADPPDATPAPMAKATR